MPLFPEGKVSPFCPPFLHHFATSQALYLRGFRHHANLTLYETRRLLAGRLLASERSALDHLNGTRSCAINRGENCRKVILDNGPVVG
jgi:hypothetical protein